jgi:hypothetical protein
MKEKKEKGIIETKISFAGEKFSIAKEATEKEL